jgi:shikimate 5-dehydrogenase
MFTIFLENKMESKKQIILKSLKLQVLNILSASLKQTKAISRLLEFFQILYSEHQMKKIQPQIREVVDQQSLIINATGMGKDLPGSPWPDGMLFPKNSFLWELNYRGSLEFYHQGKLQEKERNLTVIDGWRYFIYGWTQVISEVFDVVIDKEMLKKLATQAEASR